VLETTERGIRLYFFVVFDSKRLIAYCSPEQNFLREQHNGITIIAAGVVVYMHMYKIIIIIIIMWDYRVNLVN